MIKIMLIRTISCFAVAAAFALLAACTPTPPPAQAGQPVPPGPTSDEVANYATAEMQYRRGMVTGNDDMVAGASETFQQIPREIFSRQAPRLFEAEVACERYRVAEPDATGRSIPTAFEPQCHDIGWRYDGATNAIGQDLRARIAAADFATIAQAGPTHR